MDSKLHKDPTGIFRPGDTETDGPFNGVMHLEPCGFGKSWKEVFFPNGAEFSLKLVNSANSGNLINH